MFLSNNNSDHENPLESLLLKKPSFFHHHQNPKQDDPLFSNFPSPFFDEHELIMPLNQTLSMPPEKPEPDLIENTNSINPTKTGTSKRTLKEKANDPASKRRNLGKRTGKKDRHSKIRTAQGVRDRRMRLSLQIARKFFDLQDMLGYDKASSTIEWLFGKSKKAIREVMTKAMKEGNTNLNFSISDGKSESYLSECEVVSGVEVSSSSQVVKGLGQKNEKKPRRKPNNNVRESREKARARARWRTREKMMIKLGFDQSCSSGWVNFCSRPNYCESDQRLGFCNEQLGAVDQEFLLSQDVGTIEKLLGSSSLSSRSNKISPIICGDNYQSCIDPSSNLMGLFGNWDMLNNDNQVSSVAGNVINHSSVYSAPNSDFSIFRCV
ncbi:hypothetical protein CASFOL_024297 [Castilleja foliolosa]|uniref:Uncharacterized protein n=1 Tax=Castilleja foliolosa TaxID=1961234 RepID=A0ABD3CMV4_9LAMI